MAYCDMAMKGRSIRKLTPAYVLQIRQRLAAGEKPALIAKSYGLSPGSVYFIKHGKNWSHI
jgi:hypothetical protein